MWIEFNLLVFFVNSLFNLLVTFLLLFLSTCFVSYSIIHEINCYLLDNFYWIYTYISQVCKYSPWTNYDGNRVEIVNKCFLEDTYSGTILFFLHNPRFGDRPGGDSSLSLNDRFGKYVNDAKHNIEFGSQIICLGIPLHYLQIECKHWNLQTYFIKGLKVEFRNFVSYNIEGSSLHLYIYTKCLLESLKDPEVKNLTYSQACALISAGRKPWCPLLCRMIL